MRLDPAEAPRPACERRAIAAFKAEFPDVPGYTHTCGAIGDRLELMAESGTDGTDTLDPPPLGNVDLADAKRPIGARLFIRGNADPGGTMLLGSPEDRRRDAVRRIHISRNPAAPTSSPPPAPCRRAPPENIIQLAVAAWEAGYYGGDP